MAEHLRNREGVDPGLFHPAREGSAQIVRAHWRDANPPACQVEVSADVAPGLYRGAIVTIEHL
jgi:hypothetical protein